MATQNFINECKNRANCNRLGKFNLKAQLEPVTGKNLLNKHLGFQNGYLNTSGVFTPQNQTALFNQNISVEVGETYCYSTNANIDNLVISYFGANDNFISRVKISNTDRIVGQVPNNVSYVRLAINYNNSATMTQTIIDNLEVMVEHNNTRTEPYEDYPRDDIEINQSNYLTSIELKDTCYVDDTIIGSIYTKSADVKVLDLPVDMELVGQTIKPQVGVRYANDLTEYVEFDDYIIESVNDEQTASNTEFSAMNGGTDLDKQYTCMLSFDNNTTHTIYEFYQDACRQAGLTPTDQTITNGSIVMTGNPFQNKETIRNVLQEVLRVSCSLADFNWAEKTITLRWLSDQIDYEFNTSDYSTLEGSLTQYGPINTVILGNSQLDGENVTMVDDESVAEYGEHSIMIDAPYFLYTEELRNEAIQAIYDKLDGLTYYDLKLTTPYGKPFLKIGDKIRINTNENQTYDTYVLSHTFTYDGTFGSVIESPALTSEEQKIKNVRTGNTVKERLLRTEVIVDKTTGDISALNDKVSEVEDEFGNYYTIEQTNSLIANAETGVTNTFSEAGGNNIFRNTGLWFEDTKSGKNLFNSSDVVTGYLDSTGTIGEASAYRVSGYISVEPNQTYTYQGTTIDTNYGAKIGYYDSDRNWVTYEDIVANGATITIPNNIYYLRTTVRETELSTYQIEEGSTATSYENFYHPYEFWSGMVERITEDRAASRNAMLLKNTTLTQNQTVPNGSYTVSFKYKKLLSLAEVKAYINGVEYELDSETEYEFQTLLEISSQIIRIDFVSNTDDACEIYDLMVNAGRVKLAYSQNQNETTTDTVNISKGITITSSTNENIIFKADYDGTRIYDKTDMGNPITKFTDKGIKTKEIEAEDHNKISGVLIQKIGNQTWFTKI